MAKRALWSLKLHHFGEPKKREKQMRKKKGALVK
jgi:hypothetical protein